jgi:DNA-binding XRE family transcriptional regulator
LQFVPATLKALKPKETDFEPPTLGEHIRKRRLELRLTQKQAAGRAGVNPWTVLNWEKGHTEPRIVSMPDIIRFSGYDFFPAPKNIPDRLFANRRSMGWSIKEAARGLRMPGL